MCRMKPKVGTVLDLCNTPRGSGNYGHTPSGKVLRNSEISKPRFCADLRPNSVEISVQNVEKSRFSDFRWLHKLFPMGYDHNSPNPSGYYIDLKLCQLWASYDTYFATDRQNFHTPPFIAGSGVSPFKWGGT